MEASIERWGSGGPWEAAGVQPRVRAGDHVHVAGTTATVTDASPVRATPVSRRGWCSA
ncbi:MAG: hypothetical protein R2715_04720 [Ilumatobacteraceae bacterium]